MPTYGYDLNGNVTSIVYPNGVGSVSRGFDAAGRLVSVRDWLGRASTFSYDADSNPARDSYGNGTSTVWSVDSADRLMGITHSRGVSGLGSFSYRRDSVGRETGVTSTGVPADDHLYSYNRLSFLTGVDASPAAGYGYDRADNLMRMGDAGQVFDAANELVSRTAPIGFVQSASAKDEAGSATSLTASLGSPAQEDDQVLLAVSVAASATVSVPDPARYTLVVSQLSGDGNKLVVYRYRAARGDSQVMLGFPGASVTSLQAKTLAVAVYRGVDPLDPIDASRGSGAVADLSSPEPITVGSIDASTAAERLVMLLGAARLGPAAGSWTAPAGMTRRADVSLSSTTNVTSVADETLSGPGPSGDRTATFDVTGTSRMGVLVALRPAATRYGYDARGDRVSTSPPGAASIVYRYDQANRLVSVSGPLAAVYGYRGDGLRLSRTAGTTTSVFSWDESGSVPLLLAESAGGSQTNYIYGPGGRVIEQIAARPVISRVATGAAYASPTAAGPLTATLSGAVKPRDLLVALVSANASTSFTITGTGWTTATEITANGNTSRVYTKLASGAETDVAVSYSGGTGNAKTLVVAVYRNVDPQQPLDATPTIGTQAANPAGPETVRVAPLTTTDNGEQLLLAVTGQGGSVLNGSWTTPGYTQQATATGAQSAATLADATQSTAGSTGNATATYDQPLMNLNGFQLALRRAPTPVLYYHPDQLGSARILTDNNGDIASTYTYDPYGRLAASTVTTGYNLNNPFGYAGQYTDPETGLQYLRARYYDPGTGQFLTRDPLTSVTREPYGYAGNDPLNGIDPTGLIVHKKIGGAISSAGDALGSAAEDFVAAGSDFIAEHRDGIEQGLDWTATGLSAVAVVADATGVGALAGVPLGYVSAGFSTASAGIECAYGDDSRECAKRAAVASLSWATAGISTAGVAVLDRLGFSQVGLDALRLAGDLLGLGSGYFADFLRWLAPPQDCPTVG